MVRSSFLDNLSVGLVRSSRMDLSINLVRSMPWDLFKTCGSLNKNGSHAAWFAQQNWISHAVVRSLNMDLSCSQITWFARHRWISRVLGTLGSLFSFWISFSLDRISLLDWFAHYWWIESLDRIGSLALLESLFHSGSL